MIKERPILYSTDMVRAILANRKTKTRRAKGFGIINDEPSRYRIIGLTIDGEALFEDLKPEITPWITPIKCPYGKPGDVLWVRETWCNESDVFCEGEFIVFKAGNETYPMGSSTWKPSIHMKKIHARIWLEITDLKVERLREITEEDAIAEGVEINTKLGCVGWFKDYLFKNDWYAKARPSFFSLWRLINGTDSLRANPWVWVISFKVLSTTGKPEHLEAKSSRLEAS